MVVQDEQDGDFESIFNVPIPGGSMREGILFAQLQAGVQEVEDVGTHYRLRNDIIDHLWEIKGSS
jgi:hypothetical protein